MVEKEYIEREAALEIVRRTSGDYAAAFSEIGRLPTADVAPRAEIAEEIFAELRKCWARRLFDCDDFSFKDFSFEDFEGDLDELYHKYMGDQT